MDSYQLMSFLLASVVLTLMPGPDILFVVAQSISGGWRKGVSVAVGLCSGLVVHTSAVALGVAAILSKSASGLLIVKVAGAAYLLYLAYKSWGENGVELTKGNEGAGYFRLVRIGFVMNVLNPKVLLFFLAFLPQFVVPNDTAMIQVFALGALFFVQALLIFSLVAFFSGLLNSYISSSSFASYMGKAKAIVFLLIAANLFWV